MFVFERPIFCKLRNIKPPKDKGKFSIFRGFLCSSEEKFRGGICFLHSGVFFIYPYFIYPYFIYPYFIYPYSLSVYNGAGETVFELCLGAIIICAALTGFTKWKKCRMLRADGVRAGNGILAHPTNEAVEQLTKRIEKMDFSRFRSTGIRFD
ncbi:hypothetical protein [Allobaculum sp. Allo2]|uniref:hypothetical protein n=1 Tax=Allobaculum sp. Allo2 TaxID=2853432 RepID=UPI001F60BED3|nr:hypothetical protein [Allobaculum sp. Allo2]UNT93935.1 hypothetical protein KWG61_04390 [Allobaculum sp. Allo2]